jgi:8-oxo-dGTP pyrophosphatase MutT (NUDIX family)
MTTQHLGGIRPEDYWEYQPGERVMTIDGFPGVVELVEDGPIGGAENYVIKLDNGMGGGNYSASMLAKMPTSRAAAGVHLAAEDYPELGGILDERPDPGKMTFAAALSAERQDADAEDHDEPGGNDTPSSCSYCGSTDFQDLTDNGRVRQATCATCGGTMSAHEGAQWTPELIGDPSNHPSPAVDPRSGASVGTGSPGQAGINDFVDFDSRVSTTASGHLDLYHRTTPEAAERIRSDRSMHSKENTGETYWSTFRGDEPDAQAAGYGAGVVHIRVPHHLAEIDDEFPSGEEHYRVHPGHLEPHHFVEGKLAAYSAGPCPTCKGEGSVSWTDQDPDWGGDPDENPGKVHTAPCDDCGGKGHVPAVSDEEIAHLKQQADENRARSTTKHVQEKHPIGEVVTYDDVKGCGPRCPVAAEWDRRGRKPFYHQGSLNDDRVRQAGFPALHSGDTHAERTAKLTHHYEHLWNDEGPQEEAYAQGHHPLAVHHQEHGVPKFEENTHLAEEPRVKAPIAAQLSRHLVHLPAGQRPNVSISTPRYDGAMEDGTLAYFSPERNRIGVHRGLARSEEHHPQIPGVEMPKEGWLGRHDSTPLKNHVLTHESGHKLDYAKHDVSPDDPYSGNEQRSHLLNKISGAIPGATPYKHGDSKYHWMLDNREHFINHVGTYAATDPSELIGELYAQHHHHPEPSDAARVVGQHLDGESDDDRGTHAGEAGSPAGRAAPEGVNSGSGAGHREDRDPAGGAFRGRLTPEAAAMLRTAARDRDLGFHVTASWADVQRKAKRIRSEGGVTIVIASNDGIGGRVKGDHGTYEALLVYRPGTKKVADWTCGCKWAAYAFDRAPAFSRFEGRKCSHALALQFEAQSQGMFGKEVHPAEPTSGERAIVRYDPDAAEHVFARPYAGSLIGSLVARLRAEDADPGEVVGNLVRAGVRHRTAVLLWKDAEHHEDGERRCPHCGGFIGVEAVEHHRCPHCGAPLGGEGHEHHHEGAKQPPGPHVSGIALKAHDTGRVLMLQRRLDDEDDPAAGTWEFPGGHNEEGDLSSLHSGIREFEEEVGQQFPLHGVVKHVWTSPNGVYQGHVVVIPSEKDLSMKDGRVVPNPDDPKGDCHEQAAWWDPEHARKNPALRLEVKENTPWNAIAKASLDAEKTAAAWDPISNVNPQPGRGTSEPAHSNTTNPASTGWAAGEDPDNWDNLDANPEPLTPSLGFDAVLHDEPEPALPTTYGDEDATMRPAEMTQDDLDPVPDNPPAQMVPDQDANIHLLDGGSSLPNSYHASAPESQGVADVIAAFQRTAAGQELLTAAANKPDDDIAAAAKAHLAKEAAAKFDFAEQQELINEGNDGRKARNLGDLKIEGTHYELLEAALAHQDADPSDIFS